MYSEQLSSLFTVKNIPKDKIEKAIHAAEKLIAWVDRNRAGDAQDDDEETWEDTIVLSDSAFKYEYGGSEKFHSQKPLVLENLQDEASKLKATKKDKVIDLLFQRLMCL